jgi:hypothetical protein
MMKLLKSINWKRIGTIAVGAVGVYESAGGTLPSWVMGVAGLIAGTAINAEKVMAKRNTPSNPFSTVDAQEKVDRLK